MDTDNGNGHRQREWTQTTGMDTDNGNVDVREDTDIGNEDTDNGSVGLEREQKQQE